jgi:uncharacterized membrane protein YsdA (DUF1294 family)
MSNAVTAIAIYLSIVVVMSVISFAVYGLDKRQAVTGGRRVRERTLHVLAFLGGWPGAMLGQRRFRHKTRKVSFLIAFWMVVVFHVGLVVTTGYLVFGPGDSKSAPAAVNQGS